MKPIKSHGGKNMQTELSASMMCANFGNLEKEIKLLEDGGIDSFHIDIMDGQFVPNFCMGIQDLKCIRKLTNKPVEAHLMIKRPLSYLKVFIESGVNVIYVHPEADYQPATTLQLLNMLHPSKLQYRVPFLHLEIYLTFVQYMVRKPVLHSQGLHS